MTSSDYIFQIHPMGRGVRHMPSVLTGAWAEPRHGLSQGLLGETAPSLHLLGLSPPATMETSQYACLHTSLSTTPIRALSHTSFLSPVFLICKKRPWPRTEVASPTHDENGLLVSKMVAEARAWAPGQSSPTTAS